MSDHIVIIGAGIIGLTTALTLQSTLPPTNKPKPIITIIAQYFPTDESINYSSPWAGAHYRPIPTTSPQLSLEATWCHQTYSVLKKQAVEEPEAGIRFLDGVEYFESPSKEYLDLLNDGNDDQNGENGNLGNGSKKLYGQALEGFRVLKSNELPKEGNVKLGITYKSWSINSPVYCSHLLRKFLLSGGKTLRYTLANSLEAFALFPTNPPKTVINCSGYGFGDKEVVITRGQTCLVSNKCDRTITQQNEDGTWCFLIPRPLNGGTIVGGTKEVGDWNVDASEEARKKLLENAGKMWPRILSDGDGGSGWEVIRDIVGRRPTRNGGMRLEVERVEKGRIVHAYGAGGRGYEMSWGVAEEVLKMVLEDSVTSKL